MSRRYWSPYLVGCCLLTLFLFVPKISTAQEQPEGASERPDSTAPLTLERFLEHVVERHPKVSAARFNSAQADAGITAARGAFDLKVEASAQHYPVGTYNKSRYEVGAKQPTTVWGSELWLKYRNGWNHPSYDGDFVTTELGQISAGVLVPLLRDGLIDERRLELVRRKIEREIAEYEQKQTTIDVLADAASLWWKWAILGQKCEVYRRLVRQAEQRATFLGEQVRVGALAQIETIDNKRLILSRRAKLNELSLQLRQTALKMGLYRRLPNGTAQPASAFERPELNRKYPAAAARTRSWEKDIESVPTALAFESALRLLDQEVRAANNQQLPRLDLKVGVSHGAGQVRYYSPTGYVPRETAVGGSLTFGLDVQRRKTRGKTAALQHKKRALKQKYELFKDTTRVDLAALAQAIEMQRQIAMQNHEATQLAQKLVEAETASLEVGQSTIMNLNIREQAVLNAGLAELEALLEFHLASIELQRLRGKSSPEDYYPIAETTKEDKP